MKKRSRFICILLTGVLMLMSFSGCSKQDDYEDLLDEKSPVTITIWHYYNGVQQTQFDEMVSEFNSTVGLEKGIIVEAISKNSINELADSVKASAAKEPGAEDMPDIFASYAETAYIIDEMGYVADLKKYFSEKELNAYIDEYIEEGSFDKGETLRIFPTAKSTEVMMLNQTDWQKFADAIGVSYDDMTTWEGLAEVAEQYYNYTDSLTPDVENDGKAFFGRDSIANYMNIGAKQLGAAFSAPDADGTIKTNIDKTVIRRLWDNYYVPYVKGYYTAENRYRSDDAKIGSIIALICSTSGAIYYPTEVTINDEYTYPIENVVLPVPNFEGCDSCVVQQGAGMSVVKSSDKKEYASCVFLKWFTDTERNIQFSINSGYLPVKEEANDLDRIRSVSTDTDVAIDDTMERTIATAIGEIRTCNLYTSPAFENSTELRDYIGDTMQETSEAACKEAWERIASGEDRETVLKEYTDDAAFETWYAAFEKGFLAISE